jgi:hypothetical protein
MALARYVLTATVTLTPDAVAAAVAGEPGTGGPAGFGSSATIVPAVGSEGKFGLWPMTLLAGTAIYADATAGFATGAQLLYQAIGAGNLAAWRDGTDNVSHSAISNLRARVPGILSDPRTIQPCLPQAGRGPFSSPVRLAGWPCPSRGVRAHVRCRGYA